MNPSAESRIQRGGFAVGRAVYTVLADLAAARTLRETIERVALSPRALCAVVWYARVISQGGG